MVQSAAKTVAAYLAELPAERRAVIAQVRKVIRRNLPKGYQEVMNWGRSPTSFRWSATRIRTRPAALPLRWPPRRTTALYLMTVYGDKQLEQAREAFKMAGKKLDHGEVVRALQVG
jgi:hypothetical protein